MRCGSRNTYLLFLAKKNPQKTENTCQVFFFFLGKVGIGGQRKKEEDKKGE